MKKIQRLFGAQKAGHTGSLDPLATGMLPICLGEATKFSHWMLTQDKTYVVTGQLGTTTTTGDAEGEVLQVCAVSPDIMTALSGVLPQFVGAIDQVPPMYSALKQKGVPLYRLARRGQIVDRPARAIRVDTLTLLDQQDLHFKLRVHCSKGTYIRSLVEAIGEVLGVGAHVTQLHRESTAGFEASAMYTLEQFTAFSLAERMQQVLPTAQAVSALPRLSLQTKQSIDIRHGRVIEADVTLGEWSLWDETGVFMGVGLCETVGCVRVKRLKKF